MTKVSKQTLTINPLVSIMKMAFLFINLNLITPKYVWAERLLHCTCIYYF